LEEKPDEILVCSFSLDSPGSDEERWAGLLDESDRARAEAFHFERDRRRFVAVRGVLRTLLARRLDRDPCDLRFRSGPWGKPHLADDELEFSVSHSKSWALIAIHPRVRLGIDLEPVRALPDLLGVAKKAFTAREWQQLSGLPPERQEAAFFRIWTRKEALAKALGEGLRAMPHFSVDAGEDAKVVDMAAALGDQSDWRMLDLHDIPLHTACLAVEASDWQIRFASMP